MSFMSIPTTLRGYNDASLTHKKGWFKAQYPYHRLIMDELDNANSIHAFNRFEMVFRTQCHFRLVDIPCDIFYAWAMPAIQE